MLDLLQRYHWPGNVRELQHLMRYAATVCEGGVIGVRDLPWDWVSGMEHPTSAREQLQPEDTERVLEQCGWNISLAAQRLSISRATLHRRVLQFELKRPAH